MQTILMGDLAGARLRPIDDALADRDSKAGNAKVAKVDFRKALRFIFLLLSNPPN